MTCKPFQVRAQKREEACIRSLERGRDPEFLVGVLELESPWIENFHTVRDKESGYSFALPHVFRDKAHRNDGVTEFEYSHSTRELMGHELE